MQCGALGLYVGLLCLWRVLIYVCICADLCVHACLCVFVFGRWIHNLLLHIDLSYYCAWRVHERHVVRLKMIIDAWLSIVSVGAITFCFVFNNAAYLYRPTCSLRTIIRDKIPIYMYDTINDSMFIPVWILLKIAIGLFCTVQPSENEVT